MLFKEDLKRYKYGNNKFLQMTFNQGVWAVAVYRFGNWAGRKKIPVISLFLKTVYFFLNKTVEILTGISISSNALIGPGLYIGHFGNIFIHSGAKIGRMCNIGQGVTIGTLGLGKKGAPNIGNNVYIGAGAKVLGDINIGNNARIGANAVVITDIPDNATAVGIPATVKQHSAFMNENLSAEGASEDV